MIKNALKNHILRKTNRWSQKYRNKSFLSTDFVFINVFLDFLKAKAPPYCPRLAILGSDAFLFFLGPSNKVNSQENGQFIWKIIFSKFHKISSHGRSLISLRHQYIWTNSVVLAVFVDQVKNMLLQAYYKVNKLYY